MAASSYSSSQTNQLLQLQVLDGLKKTLGAALSTAKGSGVSVADIMKTADWSRETTFSYYRSEKVNTVGMVTIEVSNNYVL